MALGENSAIINNLRSGLEGDEYVQFSNVQYKVINGKVQLNEIPDRVQRVQVRDIATNQFYFEKFNDIPQDDEYVVDYTQGIVTFSTSAEGKILSFDWAGRGVAFHPVDRVWTQQENGQVVETLGTIIQAGRDGIDNINTLNTLIDNTNVATQNVLNAKDQFITEVTDINTQLVATTENAVFDMNAKRDSFKYDAADYSATKQYKVNNQVTYNGKTYICILDTIGHSPVDTTYWRIFASGSDSLKRRKSWVSALNATDFDISDVGRYAAGTVKMEVYVGGALQEEGINYDMVTPTLIRFRSPLPAGLNVIARWFDGDIGTAAGHNAQHRLGGGDELYASSVRGSVHMANLVHYGADNTGTADCTSALLAAISDPSDSVFVPKGVYLINQNVTITDTEKLVFDRNARFKIANGKTLTVNGVIEANPWDWTFDLSLGGVVAGRPKVKEVYPQWFGAVEGNNGPWAANYVAFKNAFAVSSVVHMTSGIFSLPQVVLTSGKKLIGEGVSATTIQFPNSTSLTTYTEIGTKQGIIYIEQANGLLTDNIIIEGFTIDGNWGWLTEPNIRNIAHGLATADSGSDDTIANTGVTIRNVYFYNIAGDAIHSGSHDMGWRIDNVIINRTYGHGLYIPRISDSSISNFESHTTMKSGIWQGVGTDNAPHGGNNRFSNLKIYYAGDGKGRGYYTIDYPAMIVQGALNMIVNADIQQNCGDGLVIGGHMTTANGLVLDSNGRATKTDSANLRIISGCMFSKLSGIISGNRFTDASGTYMRTKYGLAIEAGKIGYNSYDFAVDEMEYTRDISTAYSEGFHMEPYNFVINDPSSNLFINGRKIFDVVSTDVPNVIISSGYTYSVKPTVSSVSGGFDITIAAGETTSVARTASIMFNLYSAAGTDNPSTATFYNTKLSTAKYFVLTFRCKGDFPIPLSARIINYYSGGYDGSNSNVVIRKNNNSSAYRDIMVYIPVNTASGATTNASVLIDFNIQAGTSLQNRVHSLNIRDLKYSLV